VTPQSLVNRSRGRIWLAPAVHPQVQNNPFGVMPTSPQRWNGTKRMPIWQFYPKADGTKEIA
jgi:hypothetical protein